MDTEQEKVDILREVVIKTHGIMQTSTHILPTVTATVNNRTVIEDEKIKVSISIDNVWGKAEIGIFWEKYGYKNYKDMGLFGIMRTGYHDIIDTGNNTFRIKSDSYIIDINYNNCAHSTKV